jgi:hypothetical protein
MIEWPSTSEKQSEKVIALFKKTAFAAELDEDSHTWSFRAFARSPDPPARVIVRSDGGETRIFSLEATGFWRRVVDQDAR